ncbi:MAG: hypothetical protein O2960_21625 [Verrucomicrobia bacterium]|nr:hypothetical protein [Verrucomicrobiota bacterium]
MSFVLEFLLEAFAEAECVTGDYEARSAGLGSRFRAEVESACAAIVQHPLLWRLRPGGYRRVNLPGFPYYIAFVLDEERAHFESKPRPRWSVPHLRVREIYQFATHDHGGTIAKKIIAYRGWLVRNRNCGFGSAPPTTSKWTRSAGLDLRSGFDGDL